ncbi:MAG: NADH-quinone oxidoreductase subunit C [Deltaproteobacteria bacterium]|nr:NADH-quinone oxidoreductase subunit C [Deltaproteobacteria bacterium]
MAKSVVEQLRQRFGNALLETADWRGDEVAVIRREELVSICRWLKETPELALNFLMDICGVDYPERSQRFEVVYHCYSLATGRRIRLKVRVSESDPVVPTVTGVWIGADWFERECYDLFGIKFAGHPNLKRLLTYEEFEGHALRRDYPRNKRQKIPTPDPLIS